MRDFLKYSFVIVAILVTTFFVMTKKISAPTRTGQSVKINEVEIPVELATSSAALRKGLSGRQSLPENSGMLFAFSKTDIYKFWMPDMNFPIDIIWINGDKVVDIDHDVSNEFDSKNPKFYTPQKPVNYVIEVNAGFSRKNNINIGDSVIFNLVQ